MHYQINFEAILKAFPAFSLFYLKVQIAGFEQVSGAGHPTITPKPIIHHSGKAFVKIAISLRGILQTHQFGCPTTVTGSKNKANQNQGLNPLIAFQI